MYKYGYIEMFTSNFNAPYNEENIDFNYNFEPELKTCVTEILVNISTSILINIEPNYYFQLDIPKPSNIYFKYYPEVCIPT